MTHPVDKQKKLQAQARQERLAVALRSNLHRRKEQARGRAADVAADIPSSKAKDHNDWEEPA